MSPSVRGPRRHLTPAHGFPRVVGGFPPIPTETPATTGTEPAREDREAVINESAESKALPLIYGLRKVGALWHVIAGKGDNLVVQYLIGSGPLEDIVSQTFDGYDSGSLPAGVSFEEHLGAKSPLPSVSAILASTIPSYPHRHPGVAHVVAEFSGQSELWGSIPEWQGVVKGRKDVYDPRLDTTPGADPTNPLYQAYTTNPVLIAAHAKTDMDAGLFPVARVNWDRIALLASRVRYTASAAFTEPGSPSEIIGGFLACFQLYEVWDRGDWYVGGDTFQAPVAIIDVGNLAAREVDRVRVPAWEETTLGADEVPEVVEVQYPEPLRQWENYAQRYPAALGRADLNAILSIQAPYITDASQAARLAEEVYWQRRRCRRFRAETLRHLYPLERGDIVDARVPGTDSERAAIAFDGIDGIAEVEAAGLDLTGSATVEARVRVPAATAAEQVLVDRYGTGYGYGLAVSATGYLVARYGSAEVTTACMIADGVWHHVALVNEASKKLKVYVDCALVAFVAAVAGAAAGTDWTSLGARHGGSLPAAAEVEEVRLWSTARTAEELEQWAWRSDVPGAATGLVACWRADEGTGLVLTDQAPAGNDMDLDGGALWVEHGEQLRVVNVSPKPDGGIDLELAELSAQSYATATVLSAGDDEVDRVDTYGGTSTPDPSAAPSPAENLVLTVIKRIGVLGAKPFAIKVHWDPSPSGFVRGYEVTLTVDGDTTIVGQYARHATECLIEVLHPELEHTVTVYAVATGDTRSSGISDSVTPGTLELTVSLDLVEWFLVRAPIQMHEDTNQLAHDGLELAWSVADDTVPTSIKRFEIYTDGILAATYAATAGNAVIEAGSRWGSGLNTGNTIGGVLGAAYISAVEVAAVLFDGRMVVSAPVAPSEASWSPDRFLSVLPEDDLASVNPADGGHSLHPAAGASPTDGMFYHYDDSHWQQKIENNGFADDDAGWQAYGGGTPWYYLDITFEHEHLADPIITLGGKTPQVYWCDNVTTTGFRLYAIDGVCVACRCYWESRDPL